MEAPLLQTKLYIPSVRPGRVSRPRLIERLNAGLQSGRQLTLVSAPAGFGKTTLLSEWVADCGRPVAWLSLDKEDDDLARFLAYLVGALQTLPSLCEAGVGESALAMLHASRPQPPPTGAILTALINEIATLSTPLILVLDDYHLIQARPIHDALTFLLDHLPPTMHLALVTRADPPLPVARRARPGTGPFVKKVHLFYLTDYTFGYQTCTRIPLQDYPFVCRQTAMHLLYCTQ